MGELESAEGNGRPSKKDAWSVAKNCYNNKFEVHPCYC
jgi:hypothetical protein